MNKISISVSIDGPIERVWDHVTSPALIEAWLMKPAGFNAQVGTQFTFDSECDGKFSLIRCEVIEVVPNALLAFTWVDDTIDLHTVIRIHLCEERGTTRVVLDQSGWEGHDPLVRETHKGTWVECLGLLARAVLSKPH